jgi:hypothetical protein
MDEVIIKFANENQCKTFMKWFTDYGYDELLMSDSVRDDLSSEDFYGGYLKHIPGGFKIT